MPAACLVLEVGAAGLVSAGFEVPACGLAEVVCTGMALAGSFCAVVVGAAAGFAAGLGAVCANRPIAKKASARVKTTFFMSLKLCVLKSDCAAFV